MRPRRLKLGTHVGSGQMYHVYWSQAAAAYSSLYFFIFHSLQFSTFKCFVTLFSGTVRPRRLKLGTHVNSGQMYHVDQNQAAAAAYSSLYVFIFLLSLQFSTLKFFITLFSGTVRPRSLKIGTHVDSGQLYHRLPESGCCCLFMPLFLHFSFSPIFNIEIFHHFFLRNCEAYKIEIWYTHRQWADVSCILESGCCCIFIPLFLHLSFSSNFQTLKCFITLFWGTDWGLEDWNLVHMWIVGRCIVCAGIRLLLLICPFISSFFFLSKYQTLKFSSHFSQELWDLEDWNLVHTWIVGRCILESGCCCLFVPLFLHFSFSPIFKH